MKTLSLLIALLLPAVPVTAHAQSERDDVLAVVQGLFDAMRDLDTARIRSLITPQTRLLAVGEPGGTPAVMDVPMDRFIAGVGRATEPLDERFFNPEVRIDGRLATVWTEYVFYVGERFSHCGVDAFQLARLAGGWKIIQIADTRRRENCEMSDEAGQNL